MKTNNLELQILSHNIKSRLIQVVKEYIEECSEEAESNKGCIELEAEHLIDWIKDTEIPIEEVLHNVEAKVLFIN